MGVHQDRVRWTMVVLIFLAFISLLTFTTWYGFNSVVQGFNTDSVTTCY